MDCTVARSQQIAAFQAYWQRSNPRFLRGYSLGDYFISRRFEAARPLLAARQPIRADMVRVTDFRDDYLRMADEAQRVDQDGVFTATPFPGLPWMEAMLGCEVSSTGSSFIAHPVEQPLETLRLTRLVRPEWFDKYLEFTDMLRELSRDRFAVGQPILRGPTDIVGTMLGQAELVYALHDHPERVIALFEQAADCFLEVIRAQKTHLTPFHGGCALGFYDVWCPDDCLWFQDDLTALLSPRLYADALAATHARLARSAAYTMMHLHPASFYVVDALLEVEALNAIQINKDVGGPSVEAMLPVLRTVQQRKNLVFWGDITPAELDWLADRLPPAGVYLMLCRASAETINESLHTH